MTRARPLLRWLLVSRGSLEDYVPVVSDRLAVSGDEVLGTVAVDGDPVETGPAIYDVRRRGKVLDAYVVVTIATEDPVRGPIVGGRYVVVSRAPIDSVSTVSGVEVQITPGAAVDVVATALADDDVATRAAPQDVVGPRPQR